MRLIVGPAGSGKTALVLGEFREAVRAGNYAVRLLAPTATLVRHWQNQLAREGLLLRPTLIQTLSGFVREWCVGEEAPGAVVYLLAEDAVRRLRRPEFARMMGPDGPPAGFCASLARRMEEFASAGSSAERLADALPDAPLAAAFLATYQEVERQLERRGLALRGRRLEQAAARLAAAGAGGVETIWLDGFHALPEPELRVIEALGRHTRLTLTACEEELGDAGRARLKAMGFSQGPGVGSRPRGALALVKAPAIEREAEEIARRILEQAAAGRPFREMGIVVRAPDIYVPVLRLALERFGIPARFYFDQPFEQHPVARFLTGAVDAMLSGWEHAATLKVLRLAPRFANSGALDRLDFLVRERLPSGGLAALRELALEAHAEKLEPLLDQLGAIEQWRSMTLAPKDWAAQLGGLRRLFRPDLGKAGELPAGHERALEWRGQAEALELAERAFAETALALEDRALSLEPFWRAAKAVMRLQVLRPSDQRRNVVHVLSAPEARQWVLPVVFVCGLVEKQFPQVHSTDPFFPEAARARLNQAGIRVRTAAEFEREERALFESAVSRATLVTTLSYPEFDARGERNLRSLYLEELPLAEQSWRPVRPAPRRPFAAVQRQPVRAAALLEGLRAKTSRLSPTALETYLQCPFQYFGRHMLRLRTAPARPEKRLDFLTQGGIIHNVLKLWYAEPQDLTALFERAFREAAEEKRLPNSYQTERVRRSMLDDLEAFAADAHWPREGWRARLEEPFVFALEEGLEISGKMDRLDVAEDGRAYVFDYKYSNAQNTRGRRESELLLQAPLYLMAAGRCFGARPQGMFYIGLKAGVAYEGWSNEGLLDAGPLPENWLEEAVEKTRRVVNEIREGRVAPAPADRGKCRWCECRDICRVAAVAEAPLAEGA